MKRRFYLELLKMDTMPDFCPENSIRAHPPLISLLQTAHPESDKLAFLQFLQENRGFELLNINTRDPVNNDRTPLIVACRRLYPTIVKFLVAHGADIHAKAKLGQTALYAVAEASQQNPSGLEIVKFLIKQGAPVDTIASSYNLNGVSALYAAATRGNSQIVELLLKNGADDHLTTERGDGPIHAAASKEKLDTMRVLLDHNKSLIEHRDGNGLTPLLVLCSSTWVSSRRVALIQFLLEQGADTTVTDESRNNSFAVLLKSKSNFSFTNTTTAMDLLVEHGANPNCANNEGLYPVHVSCINGLGAAVGWFFTNAPETLQQRSRDGLLPIHYACQDRPNRRFSATVFQVFDEVGYLSNQLPQLKIEDKILLWQIATRSSSKVTMKLAQMGLDLDVANAVPIHKRLSPLQVTVPKVSFTKRAEDALLNAHKAQVEAEAAGVPRRQLLWEIDRELLWNIFLRLDDYSLVSVSMANSVLYDYASYAPLWRQLFFRRYDAFLPVRAPISQSEGNLKLLKWHNDVPYKDVKNSLLLLDWRQIYAHRNQFSLCREVAKDFSKYMIESENTTLGSLLGKFLRTSGSYYASIYAKFYFDYPTAWRQKSEMEILDLILESRRTASTSTSPKTNPERKHFKKIGTDFFVEGTAGFNGRHKRANGASFSWQRMLELIEDQMNTPTSSQINFYYAEVWDSCNLVGLNADEKKGVIVGWQYRFDCYSCGMG